MTEFDSPNKVNNSPDRNEKKKIGGIAAVIIGIVALFIVIAIAMNRDREEARYSENLGDRNVTNPLSLPAPVSNDTGLGGVLNNPENTTGNAAGNTMPGNVTGGSAPIAPAPGTTERNNNVTGPTRDDLNNTRDNNVNKVPESELPPASSQPENEPGDNQRDNP